MTTGASGAPSGIAASAYALRARPGFVSSWLRAFAASPTSSAPESLRVASSPSSGMPTSLRTPVVRPLRRCAAKPRSWPGEEVVGEPDRRDRGDSRLERADDPAGERQAQPAVVCCLRTERKQNVAQLACPVREPAQVAPGRAVAERELDLLDRDAGLDRVARHPRLAAEPGRGREHRPPCRRRKRALPRERLAQLASRRQAKKLPGGALDDAEAAALLVREDRDCEVGVALEQRPQVAGEVGVAEQERPLPRLPLGKSERLALSPARQPEDACTGGFGLGGGPVARAVVGDDHLGVRKCLSQRGDRRADPLLLVARGDEDGQLRCFSQPGSAGARRRGRSS